MTTLRKLVLASAKLALAYILCGGIIVTANADTLHTWAVEYNGDIYTYVATTPDADGAYIVTLDGETIYIRDILGGETT